VVKKKYVWKGIILVWGYNEDKKRKAVMIYNYNENTYYKNYNQLKMRSFQKKDTTSSLFKEINEYWKLKELYQNTL
jgi:hypothetical protein